MDRDIQEATNQINDALGKSSSIHVSLEEFEQYYVRPTRIDTKDFEVYSHLSLPSEYQSDEKPKNQPYLIILPVKNRNFESCYWQMVGGNELGASNSLKEETQEKIAQRMLLELVGLNIYLPKNLREKPLLLVVQNKDAAQAIVNLIYSSPLFSLLSGKKGLAPERVHTVQSKIYVRHITDEQLHDFAASKSITFIGEEAILNTSGYFKGKPCNPGLENPSRSIENQKKSLSKLKKALRKKGDLDFESIQPIFTALLPGSDPLVIRKAFALSEDLMNHFARIDSLKTLCKRYSFFKNLSIGLGACGLSQLVLFQNQNGHKAVLGGTVLAGILSLGYTAYLRPQECRAQEALSSIPEHEIPKKVVSRFISRWKKVCT